MDPKGDHMGVTVAGGMVLEAMEVSTPAPLHPCAPAPLHPRRQCRKESSSCSKKNKEEEAEGISARAYMANIQL